MSILSASESASKSASESASELESESALAWGWAIAEEVRLNCASLCSQRFNGLIVSVVPLLFIIFQNVTHNSLMMILAVCKLLQQ